jgi:hypothetical protein
MKKQSFLILLMLVFSCSREKEAQLDDIKKIIDPFFETYRINGPKNAISKLLGSNKYIPQDVTDTVAVRLERLAKGFGKFQGVDKVSTLHYGKSIVEVTYLVNYERQPMRFKFQFYQPGTGWRIQDFRYHSDFMNDLKE